MESLRYYFENLYFGYGGGVMLYCMMRHFRPPKVGSDFNFLLFEVLPLLRPGAAVRNPGGSLWLERP